MKTPRQLARTRGRRLAFKILQTQHGATARVSMDPHVVDAEVLTQNASRRDLQSVRIQRVRAISNAIDVALQEELLLRGHASRNPAARGEPLLHLSTRKAPTKIPVRNCAASLLDCGILHQLSR